MDFLSATRTWLQLISLVCLIQLSAQKCIISVKYCRPYYPCQTVECSKVGNISSEIELLGRDHFDVVSVTDSNFSIINKGFLGSTHISSLKIINSEITTIGKKAFEGTKMTKLILEGNGIREIQNYAFNSTSIYSLSLANNSIFMINADVFKGLTNLQSLNLAHNNLYAINSFEHLPALTKLDLSHNYLTKFPHFVNLKEMKELDFSYNNLRSIGGSDFPETLWVLNVSYNQIASLSQASNISDLRTLDLSNNRLRVTGKFLDNLTSLENLFLQGNQLQNNFGEYGFFGLKQLSAIKLDRNELTTMDCAVFENNSKLEHISLSGNSLTKLVNMQKCPSSLRRFNVSQNSLESTSSLSNLKNLFSLDLSENVISVVDYNMLQNLTHLIDLNLSQNNIRVLHIGCFRDLGKLLVLNIRQNYLSNLTHGIFTGLNELKELDLGSNDLKIYNEDVFAGLGQLHSLDISSNKMENFDVTKLLSHTPYLSSINLDGNEWTCSYLANLVKQFKSVNLAEGLAFNVPNIRGIKCDDKVEESMDASNICDDKVVSKFNAIISILVMILCVIVCNMAYKGFRNHFS